MSRPVRPFVIAFALIAAIAVSAFLAVLRYPAYLRQPQAWISIAELGSVLLIYSTAAVLFERLRPAQRSEICHTAALFGCVTGVIEIVNLILETWWPALARGSVAVTFMLVVFVLWGIGGAQAAKRSDSLRIGLSAAVTSAALCMLIAVASGFVIEFFVSPTEPSAVAHWPEFIRSGWTDARAFALANTVDSGFTHLFIAPIVATIFGFAGSMFARRRRS
jgi:hypothetical protein